MTLTGVTCLPSLQGLGHQFAEQRHGGGMRFSRGVCRRLTARLPGAGSSPPAGRRLPGMPMRVRIVRPSPACTAAQMPLQAVADEHHLPGDPRGIETGNGAGAHQARAVEHHQRQRLAGDQQSANIQVRMRNPRQRAEAQPGTLIFGLPQQRQIQRLFRQRLAQRTIAIHPGDYPHLRMMPFKLPEDPRHQRFAKIFLHTKVDLAGEPSHLQRAQVSSLSAGSTSGVAHQLFAFRGEHQMAPLFGHQRRTALALQLFKLGADGRRNATGAALLKETARIHAGHKAAQGVEISLVSVSPSLSPFSGRVYPERLLFSIVLWHRERQGSTAL